MTLRKTIGGDRLGSGKKMQVDLKTYNRSTHDLGYLWRSTMSAGTLVPFMKELALPGDTFDIKLDCDIKTHPTIGPLFGSYKVQLDVFQVPFRLYMSALHNNALGVGLRMKDIKLPTMLVPSPGLPAGKARGTLTQKDIEDLGNEPSSLLAHLDIMGGLLAAEAGEPGTPRPFNGIPYLGYFDIYKNYYANKQEGVGMMINVEPDEFLERVDAWSEENPTRTIPAKGDGELDPPYTLTPSMGMTFTFEDDVNIDVANRIRVWLQDGTILASQPLNQVFTTVEATGTTITAYATRVVRPGVGVVAYSLAQEAPTNYGLKITEFPLENLDEMRTALLQEDPFQPYVITSSTMVPYGLNLRAVGDYAVASNFKQQGLLLKTYQSDLFNNYMNTEWIDGTTTGINAITAVDTSSGSFTVDALNMAKKVYEMLNRIAISGGTYDDWIETVYTHEYINRTETPVYCGGLSKELVFEEVINQSASETEYGVQPLGTLAGKGRMAQKHKGGTIRVKIDEPSYIMGIVSITPRVDYSQGNKWDTLLLNMDELHKPQLDEIGFQDLITDAMGWWTSQLSGVTIAYKSAGKQPAWINYMTNVNKVRGNFAKQSEQMFMTLNRRYEYEQEGTQLVIKDQTTYIDPSKFNFIFADTDISSQNFWVQIAADIDARRKMSAKIMPNL